MQIEGCSPMQKSSLQVISSHQLKSRLKKQRADARHSPVRPLACTRFDECKLPFNEAFMES